jgi:hypothetical protein
VDVQVKTARIAERMMDDILDLCVRTSLYLLNNYGLLESLPDMLWALDDIRWTRRNGD